MVAGAASYVNGLAAQEANAACPLCVLPPKPRRPGTATLRANPDITASAPGFSSPYVKSNGHLAIDFALPVADLQHGALAAADPRDVGRRQFARLTDPQTAVVDTCGGSAQLRMPVVAPRACSTTMAANCSSEMVLGQAARVETRVLEAVKSGSAWSDDGK